MSLITVKPELGIIKFRILLSDKNEFLSENQTEGKYEQMLDFSLFYVLSGPKCSLNVGPFLLWPSLLRLCAWIRKKLLLQRNSNPRRKPFTREGYVVNF